MKINKTTKIEKICFMCYAHDCKLADAGGELLCKDCWKRYITAPEFPTN